MGGTEYFDDLLLDSTDQQGHFNLQIPLKSIDSFVQKNGGFTSIYRFALDLRAVRSSGHWEQYGGYNSFYRLYPIDTALNFYDRNYIRRRTLIITAKDQRIQNDSVDMVIAFHRGAFIRLSASGSDTSFIRQNKLHVEVQQLSKKNGAVLRKDWLYLQQDELTKPYLLPSHTWMNIIFSKYQGADKEDTLLTLRNIFLTPDQVRSATLPSSYSAHKP